MNDNLSIPRDSVEVLTCEAIISKEVESLGGDFKGIMRMTKANIAHQLANKLLEKVNFQVSEIDLGTRVRVRLHVIL